MSGRYLEEPHECRPPIGSHVVGTVWECECGELWRYKIDTGMLPFGYWRAMSARAARRFRRRLEERA